MLIDQFLRRMCWGVEPWKILNILAVLVHNSHVFYWTSLVLLRFVNLYKVMDSFQYNPSYFEDKQTKTTTHNHLYICLIICLIICFLSFILTVCFFYYSSLQKGFALILSFFFDMYWSNNLGIPEEGYTWFQNLLLEGIRAFQLWIVEQYKISILAWRLGLRLGNA